VALDPALTSSASHARRVVMNVVAPRDGATVLMVYVVLLLGLPSRLVFAPLGGAGTPASLLGIAGAGWWTWHQVARATPSRTTRIHPVRWAALVFAISIVASFVAGMMRPIAPDEASTSQLGLLTLLSWIGVLLVAHDGPITRARLDAVLTWLVLGAGLVATLGIVQFVTGRALTNYIVVPGLTLNNALVSLGTRSGFNRPAGTALHAIEFGVVITMLLPICLHYAMFPGRLGRIRRWLPVLAIAFAVPISVSRSAIVGVIVTFAVMAPTWRPAVRRTAALVSLSVLTVVFVTIPGMAGTLIGLFTGVSTDSSALSRTDSYALAWDFISRAPIFGRGFLTFLPKYRILDNQYLGLLIDAGVFGLAAFLFLLMAGIVAAQTARRRMTDPRDRDLAQALTASVAVALVSYALFDGFSFPMFAGVTFLMVGCAGCLLRLTPRDSSRVRA
jgi:O-antigen ligase